MNVLAAVAADTIFVFRGPPLPPTYTALKAFVAVPTLCNPPRLGISGTARVKPLVAKIENPRAGGGQHLGANACGSVAGEIQIVHNLMTRRAGKPAEQSRYAAVGRVDAHSVIWKRIGRVADKLQVADLMTVIVHDHNRLCVTEARAAGSRQRERDSVAGAEMKRSILADAEARGMIQSRCQRNRGAGIQRERSDPDRFGVGMELIEPKAGSRGELLIAF